MIVSGEKAEPYFSQHFVDWWRCRNTSGTQFDMSIFFPTFAHFIFALDHFKKRSRVTCRNFWLALVWTSVSRTPRSYNSQWHWDPAYMVNLLPRSRLYRHRIYGHSGYMVNFSWSRGWPCKRDPLYYICCLRDIILKIEISLKQHI